MESARRASLVDEKTRQMRMQELVVGASRFVPVSIAMSTNDGDDRVVHITIDVLILADVGTIDGDPIAEPAGYRKLN